MTIEWTEDLATGSMQIDMQHKQLFKIINELLDECKKGQAKKEVLKVIEFLFNYVQEHFSTEEKIMEENNYPHIGTHKKQHAEFRKKIIDYREHIYSEGITLSITISITHAVVEWLTKHIRATDRELAKFLTEQIKY